MLTRLNQTHHYQRSSGQRLLGAVFLLLAALAWTGAAYAAPPPQPVSPFDITGFIQEATLDTPGDVLSGGIIKVNGHVVTIPRNTIVIFPATALTWEEVFSLAPLPYVGTIYSGLALADLPTPLASYEAHVMGNRVGDTYIAGLIDISQQSLNSGQGYINFIDYNTGEMRIGGIIGDPATGTRVRINDPIGRFGRIFSPDVRFTVDTENPTIRSETGYPMCIRRALVGGGPASECPETNRPADPITGGFQSIFTMPPPGPNVVPSAYKQTPFEVGDYVTFAGTLVQDGDPTVGPTVGPMPLNGTEGTYIAAHTITANLGIYTTPGVDPAYVAIDVTLLGVGGVTLPGLTEAATRTRFEGFSTDPSRPIDLFAIDKDCTTGAESFRPWGSVSVDPGPGAGGGAVKGRWRFRPPSNVLAMPPNGIFLPPTREVRAVVRGATQPVVANGLTTGQYRAPITEYIFPEPVVGNPPPPLNFETIPFLVNGIGPWPGGGPAPVPGPVVGQLSPWPGLLVPASTCAGNPNAPTANAGVNRTVASGALVTLAGTGTDPGGAAITFAWTQAAGPPVVLSNPAIANPSFTAPTLTAAVPPAPPTAPAVLTFQLIVSNGTLTSVPSTVSITVNPPAFVADTVNITAVVYRISKQRLDITATSTFQTPPVNPNLILTAKALVGGSVVNIGPMVFDPVAVAYTVSVVGVAQPTNVTVTSNFGGTATSGITRLRP